MSRGAELRSSTIEVEDSPEAVLEAMLEQGWSDGLPVIPPTRERVARMVDYTGRPADEIIGYLDPEGGAATVEKIAVNAVMAGCRPEYMPVLIAAVEALADPAFNLHGISTTTNPVAPLLIVNGPIRQELGFNSGRGVMGPGWRPNATIGRTIRLLLWNIGGAKPWTSDMAVQGMPGKYTFCVAENEEESAWEPLHVERGFPREQSTVTVVGSQGTTNSLTTYKQAESILIQIASSMKAIGTNNILLGGGNPLVLLTPGHSNLFVQQGFKTKNDVKERLFNLAKVPRDWFPKEKTIIDAEDTAMNWENEYALVCKRPEDILIVVSGGPEAYHATYLPNFGHTSAVTKAIPMS